MEATLPVGIITLISVDVMLDGINVVDPKLTTASGLKLLPVTTSVKSSDPCVAKLGLKEVTDGEPVTLNDAVFVVPDGAATVKVNGPGTADAATLTVTGTEVFDAPV